MELMLEAYKAARRNGEAAGHAVPLADDVWCGAHEISRRMGISPAEVIERLVVQKIAELNRSLKNRTTNVQPDCLKQTKPERAAS